MSETFLPRQIVVTFHPKMPAALQETEAMVAYLKERNIESAKGSLNDEALRKRVKDGQFDMLVAVGGDGTMLRAGHLCAPSNVPILGVNLGRLGFLIQIERDNWRGYFDRLFNNEAWIEKRMMLRTELARHGELQGVWYALNEAVVGRGQVIRPVQLAASVDGLILAHYMCDGLIAATPTGSTAYALAAGGPILPPELRNILLVPIAPHLSVDRAVVFSEGSSVCIAVHSDNAILSVDGQQPIGLAEDDRVTVRAGEYTAKFVRFNDPGYFYRNLTAHMNQNPSLGSPR
jgi:NAD+ kinase